MRAFVQRTRATMVVVGNVIKAELEVCESAAIFGFGAIFDRATP